MPFKKSLKRKLLSDFSLGSEEANPTSNVKLDRKTEVTTLRKATNDQADHLCRKVMTKGSEPSIRDVLNILFPKFLLRDRGYTPRWLPHDYSASSGFQTAGVQVLPPVDGTLELTQVAGAEPRQIWCQYPHMSVMEFACLSSKYQDLLNYTNAQGNPNRPTNITTAMTVDGTSWTTQRRSLSISSYVVEYEFTNLTNVELYIELMTVAPKDLIVEPMRTTGSVGDDLTYASENGTPLSVLCADHVRMQPNANTVLPFNNTEANFGFETYNLVATRSHTSIKGYKVEPYHRLFHDKFSVCDKKFVKLQPGQKLVYDLVVPAFTHDSDFDAEVGKYTVYGNNVQLVPTFFKKSRFLMVRSWGENVLDNSAGNMTSSDIRLGVHCRKRVDIRSMPYSRDFHTVQSNAAGGNYDVDWAGQHSNAQRINGAVKSSQYAVNEESDTLEGVA